MVSGHLEIKKGYYYVVLSYVDINEMCIRDSV